MSGVTTLDVAATIRPSSTRGPQQKGLLRPNKVNREDGRRSVHQATTVSTARPRELLKPSCQAIFAIRDEKTRPQQYLDSDQLVVFCYRFSAIVGRLFS